MSKCFFCGSNEKLTRAHLFQETFRREIPASSKDTVTLGSTSHKSRGPVRDIRFQGDIRQAKVTSLCGECNSKWMGSIEIAAAPVFESIMRGGGLPPRGDLMKLAHWSTVVAALSSELHPDILIPEVHRREIRYTRTGQPMYYSTYFIWTADIFPSLSTSLLRVTGADPQDEAAIGWFHLLHAGPLVLISSSRDLYGRVARVLEEHEVRTLLGAFSSNIVYVPKGFEIAMNNAASFPTHLEIQQLAPALFGSEATYMTTEMGSELLDLSAGLQVNQVDASFAFEGRLIDVRDDLDLGHLSSSFVASDSASYEEVRAATSTL